MALMDDWPLKREITGLKAEVDEWQKRVESYQEEKAELRDEIDRLKADLRSAERELETARLDKVDLSARVIELDAELRKLRENCECGAAGELFIPETKTFEDEQEEFRKLKKEFWDRLLEPPLRRPFSQARITGVSGLEKEGEDNGNQS